MERGSPGRQVSHIEFLRDNDGNITASGLRWCAIRQKSDSMKLCRYSAITTSRLINPHVLQVEDGKQGIIRPDVVAVKKIYRPGWFTLTQATAAGGRATS